MSTTAFSVRVTGETPRALENALDRAEAEAIELARTGGTQGVKVTRVNHNTFHIELSEAVPFGTTIEHDQL